jgi:hypothetical protein
MNVLCVGLNIPRLSSLGIPVDTALIHKFTSKHVTCLQVKKNMHDIKVFVSSVIPDIGIDMLRKENFSVITWNDDKR